MQQRRIIEIETLEAFEKAGKDLHGRVMQNLDFSDAGIDWPGYSVKGAVFLGCAFKTTAQKAHLVERGAVIFPEFDGLPYNPYRRNLYTWQELMAGYSFEDGQDHSYDKGIHDHFIDTGREAPDILEALARRIHDHAIDDALLEFIEAKKVVAVCGGHGTPRTDPFYKKVARLSRFLAKEGYLVAGGGGPGIMEACNLGAYFSNYSQTQLDRAIAVLAKSPRYSDPGHAPRAREVILNYPDGGDSLAIPTWFYGHEPSNLFASHIAKYFSNSIREDGLLALAKHGIVFAPGSAGTTQEIFMDAVQNHYGTFGSTSPMVFLGTERYSRETSIYPLLEKLALAGKYREMLTITDEPGDAIEFIRTHPPIPVK
jgi:predicted Rossmann-fold nucleotide-binding protein